MRQALDIAGAVLIAEDVKQAGVSHRIEHPAKLLQRQRVVNTKLDG